MDGEIKPNSLIFQLFIKKTPSFTLSGTNSTIPYLKTPIFLGLPAFSSWPLPSAYVLKE